MGVASFGLDIGVFYDLLYSVLLLSVILGLDFLGRALPCSGRRRARQPHLRHVLPAARLAMGCKVIITHPCILSIHNH
jgi:hypothetical protein